MSKARLVITAVIVEVRSQSELACTYGVSQSWISRRVARCGTQGKSAVRAGATFTHQSHTRPLESTIDMTIELREKLSSKGLDNGPDTIAWHLKRQHGIAVSSPSIIPTCAPLG